MGKKQEVLVSFYRDMLRIRRFEEEAARGYAQGKIGGFLHLYIGQEAIAVGAASVLKENDYIFQTYRDHGTAIARGMSTQSAMAELFGKDTGCSRGMGGSMHFFDPERGFLGGWAIVGGHLAVAAGAAFKSKYERDDAVTLCFFGEGATNIGGFHEALSLAGLWKLPIVFICENNRYAMGTPMVRTSALEDLTLKAKGYAMRGEHFQGYDVLEVQKRIKKAVDHARQGNGPSFLEIETYRFRGHSMSDPAKYRTAEELEKEKEQHDPIKVALDHMEKAKVPKKTIDKIQAEVEEEIEKAIQFANESEPAKEEVMNQTIQAPWVIEKESDHA